MSLRYSQVFLINNNIAKKICDIFSSIAGDNNILEIGPGTGILTKILYPKYRDKYTAVEIDQRMIDIIKKSFPKIKIIKADFLKLNEELSNFSYFCGNLPYHISTPLLKKVLMLPSFKAAVFMFQKEVAKKITSHPGKSEYGYLSAFVNILADTEYLFNVSRYDFRPLPRVDSAVVKITKKTQTIEKERLKNYIYLLSLAFRHKRKTLINSLSLSSSIPKEVISEILKDKNIPLNIRAEELSPSLLLDLADAFKELFFPKSEGLYRGEK